MSTSQLLSLDRIDKNNPLPYYEQLRQLILRHITGGELVPGDLLPSETELCEMYAVSRTVIRQAIGELVNEGRLQRQRGKGTFVAEPKLDEQFFKSTEGFFEDLTSRGHGVHSEIVELDSVIPSARVRDALELADGDRCVELGRVRSVDGEVITYTRSWLPERINDDLLGTLRSAELEGRSLYQILADTGVTIATGRRTLEALPATEHIAHLIDVEAGTAVMYIESVGFDANQRPVEFFRAWHRGDRTRIGINVVSNQS